MSERIAKLALGALAQAMGIELSNKDIEELEQGLLNTIQFDDVEATRTMLRRWAAEKKERTD